ncbi:carboxypeptidase-like regulatory domain-containing protein [Hymenobacter guriensis]|uniref:Carboxypeptidase-like regulatory domain-containing protein n=1 Tax=Hymenobacter guriensis TaxID=2793065 RepID=A0ABS0L2W9_9BACT|nr:carboxypeptidase-like regulatory domain-containing protein [Hymenobacter guriensis]MBG8554457.1 carboxypeptidase-like regulatory domain-containing protein [Hymenobacter guriensis]
MPTINVPKPCGESWSGMTPATQGRHCAACNKVVVDFTRMTDAELLAFLHRQPGTSCGRFTSEQLNRPLVVPAAASPWRRWLAAAALALGLGEVVASSARAQVPVSQLGQQPIWNTPVQSADISTESTIAIRGRVIDASTGQGLPNVTVFIRETMNGASTNQGGTFSLQIPMPIVPGQKLEFSSIGFLREERIISDIQQGFIAVSLKLDKRPITGAIIIERKPWPWHPRTLWNRIRSSFRH